MRTKSWARPELAACPYFTNEPEKFRGQWASAFPVRRPLWLELGCGKGVATAKMVRDCPDINFIVVDISPDVLGDCRRNIEKAFDGAVPDNVLIARFDISTISRFFAPEDEVEAIVISFCNPWSMRPKHAKRRLTHPRQLEQYRAFLKDGGTVRFKTDDDGLFDDSLVYFRLSGFTADLITRDLHRDGYTPNWVSEHEQKYTELGVPIKFGIFRKVPGEMSFDPTRWRLTPGMRGDQ
ncbi:MAG: tRNA (guanosine(46)-N7)-methyltransferase TrmB [Clostridia bacterium]|nr:tRNA (guanosine(46)-N7)-methyltransferase TrmB [Clostridia bacterium]